LFGDEGSGFEIGRAALAALARSVDGGGPATALADCVTSLWGLSTPEDLIRHVHSSPSPHELIAAVAQHVFTLAVGGDEVARDVCRSAARNLSSLVPPVLRRLDFQPHQYDLVLAGSLLIHQKSYREDILGVLGERHAAPRSTVVVPDPVAGAVRLAKQDIFASD
jgi:N-acetylglucosamine kinase-like BadF-type ATPase